MDEDCSDWLAGTYRLLQFQSNRRSLHWPGQNQSHQDFNDRTGAVVSLRMKGKEEPARDPSDASPFLTHGADDFSSHGVCKTTTLLPQPEDQLLRTDGFPVGAK